ncbi:hypothetical protein OK344_05210 [Kaistella sp. BT6-1-3]|uniref:Uncharacterized protein n=1 Tax=Kaistella yananensis TaxID=2989820 RepID=A0ABT3JLE9_9FLAO|nr:hypothetical protein [Kaistella yananensis]MCW4451602.1 hypothetical protein [Kaistella yananensis]
MITLPFKIGEQYEKWEFNLDITMDIIAGYDTYTVSKDFYCSDSISQIELTFEMDILAVIRILCSRALKEKLLKSNKNIITLSCTRDNQVLYLCTENTYLWFVLEDKEDEIFLTYGKPTAMKKLFSFLL